jgi:serine/threonine-protein kinase HipA
MKRNRYNAKKDLPLTLRSAIILYKNQVAGLLEETPRGGSRFSYAEGWRQPIACCLPLDRREHDWAVGLHPFFQHLGAEGWLRHRQARRSHVAEEDDLGLLLRYGADCIGAVSIESRDGSAEASVAELGENPGRTISGVQRKLLVVKDEAGYTAAGASGPAPYIAKFNEPSLPDLVRNELLCLRWTSAVLGTAEVAAVTTGPVRSESEHALIVTRFDRTGSGEKLRLEDFAQILAKPRGRDSLGKYDAAYEDVARAIATHSARPGIDLSKLLRRLIAFVLVGNADAHLKNFSLLETPAGLRLSPVYDVVNSALYPDRDQKLALSLGGRQRFIDEVSKAALTEFGRSIGLTRQAIDLAFAEIRRRVPRAAALLTPPEGEGLEGFKARFGEIVSRGCLRLLD